MPTTPEKKFLSCGGVTYTLVMGKRWYLEYYLERGPVVRIRKREYGQINRIKCLKAREAAAVQLARRLADERGMPQLSQSKLSLLQRTLEAARAHFRYKSYKSYRSKLKYWRQWCGATSDEQVGPAHAREFITWMAGRRSAATVRSYQRTLHGLYERAGIPTERNPFHGIKTAAPGSKSLKPFNEAQATAIINYAGRTDSQLHAAILLLFYCFLRPGEIRMLRVEDIDLERRVIEMRSEISKNKKTQLVMIPDAFFDDLRAVIGGRVGGLLLSHPTRGTVLGRGWLYKSHKSILTALKIEGRYSLYSWKHTGVVRAVKAGINLKDLQNQLRHHSLDMVNEYLKDLGVTDSEDLRLRFPKL